MKVNQDFVELLQSFDDHSVEYLIVGAHALAAICQGGGLNAARPTQSGRR